MDTLQQLANAQADPDFDQSKGRKSLKYDSIEEKSENSDSVSSANSSSGPRHGDGGEELVVTVMRRMKWPSNCLTKSSSAVT